MTLVKRYDQMPIKSGAHKTREGFLNVPAFATRTGVLKYVKPDGTIRRELRLPEEVFKSDSLKTLASKPVTYFHPEALLDSSTAKDSTVGATGGIVENVDNKFAKVWVSLYDAAAIGAIESGTKEVSCGYVCEHDETPGVWNGEPYDVIQRNIVYNHLAIVPKGRAGAEVSLRLDSEDAILTIEESKVMKLVLNGREFEVPDELGAAIQAEIEAAKASVNDSGEENKEVVDELKKENEQLEGKVDALNAEVKSLKAKKTPTMDAAQVQSEGKAFAKAYMLAKQLKVENLDSLDRQGLMRAVIKADSADFNDEGRSNVYIEARFDTVCERLAKGDEAAKAAGNTVIDNATQTSNMDAAEKKTATSREGYLARLHGKK